MYVSVMCLADLFHVLYSYTYIQYTVLYIYKYIYTVHKLCFLLHSVTAFTGRVYTHHSSRKQSLLSILVAFFEAKMKCQTHLRTQKEMHDRWNNSPMSYAWRNAERNLMKIPEERKHACLHVCSHFHMFQLCVNEMFMMLDSFKSL